jgi:hypothetical protein
MLPHVCLPGGTCGWGVDGVREAVCAQQALTVQRVVPAQVLEGGAVTAHTRVHCHDTVEGQLLAAHTREPDLQAGKACSMASWPAGLLVKTAPAGLAAGQSRDEDAGRAAAHTLRSTAACSHDLAVLMTSMQSRGAAQSHWQLLPAARLSLLTTSLCLLPQAPPATGAAYPHAVLHQRHARGAAWLRPDGLQGGTRATEAQQRRPSKAPGGRHACWGRDKRPLWRLGGAPEAAACRPHCS